MRVKHEVYRVSTALVAAVSMCAMVLAAFPQVAEAYSGTGTGTSNDPYVITSCSQLEEINNDPGASYVLGSSIDCDGVFSQSIGDQSTGLFTGTFDGKGYTIKNVAFNDSGGDPVGIFGETANATITNVRLDTINIVGLDNTGALVGRTTYTTISNVSATNVQIRGGDHTGGLVGQLGGSSLTRSSLENASVIAAGSMVGGLVGYAAGPSSVSDSYVQGSINASTIVGGAIGQLGSGPAITDEIYADVTFANGGSGVVGVTGSGAMPGSMFMANSSYLSNSTQAPLNSWDFTNIWYVRPGKYPGLRPLSLPVRLCNPPSQTATSFTVSCTSDPLLDGDPHWQLQYGYSDSTTRIPLTTQAGQSFSVTVPNLVPGTNYDLQFRYVDAVGISPWGKVVVTTTGNADTDNDGITNEVEAQSPHSGDANNDGTPDYQQANVTSFVSPISNNYVTLATACTDNYNVQLGRVSGQQPDGTYDYPAGLLGFVIRGCATGATTPVSMYFYGSYPNTTQYIARKVKNGVYSTVPDATFSNITIGGNPVLKLAYNVTDGGALDADGTADGTISDPVGFVLAASTTTPATPTSGTLTDTGFNLVAGSLGGLAIMAVASLIRFVPKRYNKYQLSK